MKYSPKWLPTNSTLTTDDIIEELQNGAKNINISKSTSGWLTMRKTWCEGRSTALEIEEHEPTKLNRLLKTFYAEVKSNMIFRYVLLANSFMFLLLISNHAVFLVQFGSNLHLKVFKS